jgi:dynein heavy chain
VCKQSAILWADLDVKRLAATSEETAKKLRQLKHLSSLRVYGLVAAEISGFQVGLPLMRDLKNDAMRHRHWDRLT